MNKMTAAEFANLSDDEILNMASPPEIIDEEPQQEEKDDDDQLPETPPVADGGDAAEPDSDDEESDPADGAEEGDDDETPASEEDSAGAEDTPGDDGAAAAAQGDAEEADEKDKGSNKEPAAEVDYKAVYEQIFKPFKANGKEIKLSSPEEVVQLMQMGANYTKKLQALQPQLKLLKMLENNGLLDEAKLSYLIDIDKKDPKAIQKLVRDSGVDPMDIDTTVDPGYIPGNHKISDEEIAFSTTLQELSATPAGKETIVTISRTWDEASKRILWSDPEVLHVVNEHRQNGLYDQISNEVERRKVLGQLGNVPFFQAYLTVGQDMQQRGTLVVAKTPVSPGSPAQQGRVIGTGTAPRKTVTNNDKARAASPTRTAQKKAQVDYNPLAMSDEEFLKSAELASRL